jgi:hypothetical protein
VWLAELATTEKEQPEKEDQGERCAGEPKQRWNQDSAFELLAILLDVVLHEILLRLRNEPRSNRRFAKSEPLGLSASRPDPFSMAGGMFASVGRICLGAMQLHATATEHFYIPIKV